MKEQYRFGTLDTLDRVVWAPIFSNFKSCDAVRNQVLDDEHDVTEIQVLCERHGWQPTNTERRCLACTQEADDRLAMQEISEYNRERYERYER